MGSDPALDILTKPLQWFLGGLKVLGFLLLAAVIAIVTPVYHLVTTGTASAMEIEVALFVLGVLILFFSAPWYTVLGGIALLATGFLYFAVNPDGPAPSSELVRSTLWGFQIVGFLWVGAKRRRRIGDYRASGREDGRTGTTRGRVQTLGLDGIPAPERPHREVVMPDRAPDWQYRALGLQNGATKTEIKQAYRDLAKIWHPDRLSNDDERLRRKAEAKLKEINEAYAYFDTHWRHASVR
jgi:DnaJ domain